MSLSRNHDPFTQDHPQTLLLAVSCKNYCLSTDLHPPAVSLYRRTRESAASSPSTIALANVKAQEASPQEVHQALKPIYNFSICRVMPCGPKIEEAVDAHFLLCADTVVRRSLV